MGVCVNRIGTVSSIETTLRDVKRRMRGLFAQERSAANAESFLDGLLGDERRKTGWMRAESAILKMDYAGRARAMCLA